MVHGRRASSDYFREMVLEGMMPSVRGHICRLPAHLISRRETACDPYMDVLALRRNQSPLDHSQPLVELVFGLNSAHSCLHSMVSCGNLGSSQSAVEGCTKKMRVHSCRRYFHLKCIRRWYFERVRRHLQCRSKVCRVVRVIASIDGSLQLSSPYLVKRC